MSARTKISQLPAAGPLTGAEIAPVVQDGQTRGAPARLLVAAPVLTEASTSRVLAPEDMGALIRCTNAGGCAVALPSDVGLAVPVGSWVIFQQLGAVQVVLSAGSGATLLIETLFLPRTLEMNALLVAVKTAPDTWSVGGSRAFA